MNDTAGAQDYLTEALRRMRLPIRVEYAGVYLTFFGRASGWVVNGQGFFSARLAKEAYLQAVKELS